MSVMSRRTFSRPPLMQNRGQEVPVQKKSDEDEDNWDLPQGDIPYWPHCTFCWYICHLDLERLLVHVSCTIWFSYSSVHSVHTAFYEFLILLQYECTLCWLLCVYTLRRELMYEIEWPERITGLKMDDYVLAILEGIRWCFLPSRLLSVLGTG